MFPSLTHATKDYWQKLDELEARFHKGQISLEELNLQVHNLMEELGEERRRTFRELRAGLNYWFSAQGDKVFGGIILALATCLWVFQISAA
jgi:hypothetical protein